MYIIFNIFNKIINDIIELSYRDDIIKHYSSGALNPAFSK